MTLVDHEDLGTYDYYRNLITDLNLEGEFEAVFEESVEGFELEISESEVIRQVLDEAPDDFILVLNERQPAYRLLRVSEG
jgi:hypothetical protein